MKKILFLLLFAGIFIFTFWSLPQTYFQQDEWHSFGFILGHGTKYIILDHSPITLLLNDRAGARTINYIYYNLFGFNAQPLIFTGILFHLLNSFLVFLIAKKLTGNKKIAYLSLLFFVLNSMSHQAFTWLGTMTGSVTSVTFVFLSVLFYLDFLDSNKNKFKYLSLFFLWISFLFKETGLFIFVFYPLIYIFFKKTSFVKAVRENILFFGYAFITLIARANEILSPAGQTPVLITTRGNLLEIVYNLIIYPIESFSQSFIPSQIMYGVSSKIVSIVSPALNPDSVEFINSVNITWGSILSIGLSIIILLGLFILYRNKNFKFQKALIISSAFLFLSIFPYVLLRKEEAYLDSRYFYVGALGSSVVLSSVINYFLLKRKFLKKLVVLGVGLYLALNIAFIRNDLNLQKQNAIERKKILNQIWETVPKLSQKTIFYIDGNSSYYGLPELKVPFQSGLGHILLIKYVYAHQIDSAFLRGKSLIEDEDLTFLYDTIDQGYREINGRGFGYFWDKNMLLETIKKYNIPVDSIYGFYYLGDHETLENISSELRKEIK